MAKDRSWEGLRRKTESGRGRDRWLWFFSRSDVRRGVTEPGHWWPAVRGAFSNLS